MSYFAAHLTPKEYEEGCKKPMVSSNNLSFFVSHLQGEILTVIDAVISEPKQNKAVKDILRNKIWESYQQVHEWCVLESGNYGKTQTAHPYPFRVEKGVSLKSNEELA